MRPWPELLWKWPYYVGNRIENVEKIASGGGWVQRLPKKMEEDNPEMK